VFFFDGAHLLFKDASKAFLEAIAQTVRLIRSKGVGVFFVTQSPTDVPGDVLAQLGSRVLGIGEAVVTVMNERGAPSPVAWTMLRAPESRMSPADQQVMDAAVSASALNVKYAEALDRDSAHEMLARKLEAPQKIPYPKRSAPVPQEQGSVVHDILTSPVAKDLARTAVREILRGAFGTARRR